LATTFSQTFAGNCAAVAPLLDCHSAEELLVKAARCRRLAAGISDRQAADVLNTMAENYEHDAQSGEDA